MFEDNYKEKESDIKDTLSEQDTGIKDFRIIAVLNNPGLRSAFESWKSSLENINQSGTLSDPRFNFTYFVHNIETRTGPQTFRAGIAQTFPWFGELKLKNRSAFLKSEIKRMEYESAKLDLFFRVEKTYFDLYRIGQDIQVVRENIKLVGLLEKVASTGYKTGRIPYSTIIRVQTELGKLEERLKSFEVRIPSLKAKMNALLGRPHQATLSIPQELPNWKASNKQEELRELMHDNNPQILEQEQKILLTENDILLSEKDFYPDFTFGVQFMNTEETSMDNVDDSGEDPIGISLSLNIPLWRQKYRSGVRESVADNRASIYNLDEMRNSLDARLVMILSELEDAERKETLFRDNLIPKTRESLEVARKAFSSGEADFTDVIDIQRELLEFEIISIEAEAQKLLQISELRRITGACPLQENEKIIGHQADFKIEQNL